ncbi:hypothetical protein QVA66_07735 [Staphylococcus chromogenes]|nr:hypothetical protein [Staphylococcus chromogenes]
MQNWWDNCIGLVASLGDVGEGGLLFEAGGQQYEVSAGGAQMHTEYGAAGMTVYADLDDDGVVDQVSAVNYDGSYQVFQREDGLDSVDTPANRGWGELSNIGHGGVAANPQFDSPESGEVGLRNRFGAGGWACVEWG